MHHDHQPIPIAFPLQLPNAIFILWFSPPKQPNLYCFPSIAISITCIHLYFFFPAPTPPPQHLYNHIVFPVQQPLKIYEGLHVHALTISLLCSHVSGSEEKPW